MTPAARAVGIDVGGTNIKIGAVWSDGRVGSTREIPTHASSGPEAALGRIVVAVREVLGADGMPPGEMRALGIDSAGIVDGASNLVLDAPNLRSWERFPLAARLGEVFGVPAHLVNDVDAMAYAEWKCGAGRGTRHLLCLTLGTGVGGGLILDGKPYRGSQGAGGEVGHMTLDARGPRCPCGSRGCLERYVGAPYIVERTVAKLASDARPSRMRGVPPAELSPRRLDDEARAGDEIAAEVLEETGWWLGAGLAGLVNVLNPERIVIGGGVAGAGDLLLEPARRTLRERAMSVPAAGVLVVPAALGNDASLVGAALRALERVQEP